MSEFVTVLYLNFPHETGVPRSLLESEGIATYLLNDHTAQVISMYAVAIGGIQLQVSKNDEAQAIQLLKDHGFVKDKPQSASSLFTAIDSMTLKWPFINKLEFVYRLFIWMALVLSILVSLLYVFLL